jgi:hypothetical protein
VDRTHTGIIVALAACGVLVVVLSFLPWVSFEGEDLVNSGTFEFGVPGTELSRLRGPDYYQPADIADQTTDVCTCRAEFGDGYITAILGGLIVVAAVLAVAVRGNARIAPVLAIAASLTAFALAGYNAAGEWQAVGAQTQDDPFVEMTGTVLPALYLLTALAAASAVLGAVLWWAHSQETEDEEEYTDFEDESGLGPENYLSWA